MNKPINNCCPTLIRDNVDGGGWRYHEPDDHYDACVRHFLDAYHDADNKHKHVLRWFHDCINDRQMKAVIQYFKHYCIAFDDNIFGEENGHMEVLKDVYFQRDPDQAATKRRLMFGFDSDNFWGNPRITSIREMHTGFWRVKRTVYIATNCTFNWRKNQSIFDHE